MQIETCIGKKLNKTPPAYNAIPHKNVKTIVQGRYKEGNNRTFAVRAIGVSALFYFQV